MDTAENELIGFIPILSKAAGLAVSKDKIVTDELIEDIETKLACKLPPSYKLFVEKFGNLILPGKWLYGIDINAPNAEKVPNVAWLSNNEQEDNGLKKGIILFYAVGDGTFYGLDTNQLEDQEAPVVAWYIDSNANDELDIIADDFAAFVRDEIIDDLD